MGFDLRRKLANLGLDYRFIFFLIIDAGIGLMAGSLILAIWFSPSAGAAAIFFGALIAIANFLLGGVPTALLWAFVVSVCKKLGASLRLACTITALIAAVFTSLFVFLQAWISDGNLYLDTELGIVVWFAPVSVMLAPWIAWKIYKPTDLPNVPNVDTAQQRPV